MIHSNEYTKKIIDLLAKQEATVSSLYAAYSRQFPDYDFWKDLSHDERIHETWVKSLAVDEKNSVFFNEGRFNPVIIEQMIAYEQKMIQEASHTTLINALGIALDIEKSLIENDYFNVFSSDSASVKHIFADLKAETEKHRKEVEQEIIRIKAEL